MPVGGNAEMVPPTTIPASSPLTSTGSTETKGTSLDFTLRRMVATLSLEDLLDVFIVCKSCVTRTVSRTVGPGPIDVIYR